MPLEAELAEALVCPRQEVVIATCGSERPQRERLGDRARLGEPRSLRLDPRVLTECDQRVHPSVVFSGPRGETLSLPIVHHVDRSISEMLRRLDRYTSARAADLRDSGDIGSYGQNLRRIVSRFWKCYVGRRGYREGPWGFLIALCAALYPILSYLKARLETSSEAAPHPGPLPASGEREDPAPSLTLPSLRGREGWGREIE